MAQTRTRKLMIQKPVYPNWMLLFFFSLLKLRKITFPENETNTNITMTQSERRFLNRPTCDES